MKVIKIVRFTQKKKIKKDEKQISVLNPSDLFGVSALKQENQVRMMIIKAVSKDKKVLGLGKDMIQQFLEDQVKSIIYKIICRWVINSSKLFTYSYNDKLQEVVQVRKQGINQKIIQKGENVSQLIIWHDRDENKVRFVKGSILFEESFQDKQLVRLLSKK